MLDRFIQQAILQVLQPIFEPTFAEKNHGFRLGRQAHDVVREAQRYVQDRRHWVPMDADLQKFFDHVNHDVLVGRLAKRIGDRRLLRILRRHLEAGAMADGVVERYMGTPEGGPVSPLLANVLLDEVDRELVCRGASPSCATRTTATYTCGPSERRSE